MSKGWDWKSGDWWINCDSCGKKIKASESRERWDGFRVCTEDWEPRHSMDFLKARKEKISVDFVRKQPDVFIETCNLASGSGYVGIAVADCARAGTTYRLSYNELLQSTYCSEERRTGMAGIGYAGCLIPLYNADAYL